MAADDQERPRRGGPPRARPPAGRPPSAQTVRDASAGEEHYEARSPRLSSARRDAVREDTEHGPRTDLPGRRQRRQSFVVPVEEAAAPDEASPRPRRLMPNRKQTSELSNAGRQTRPERVARSPRANSETAKGEAQRAQAGNANDGTVRQRRQRASAGGKGAADPRGHRASPPAVSPEAAAGIIPEVQVDQLAVAPAAAPSATEAQAANRDGASRRARTKTTDHYEDQSKLDRPQPVARKTMSRRRARLSPIRKRRSDAGAPAVEGPLVAPKSLGGRSLTLFLAVMTFLSAGLPWWIGPQRRGLLAYWTRSA